MSRPKRRRIEAADENRAMPESPDPDSSIFLENFKSTRDLANDAFKTFDKSIISLAAGALFLTITFVEKLAPEPVATILLKSSWGAFAIALLAIVASQATSARSLTCQAQNLIAEEFGNECRRNRWEKPTEILNWTSMLAFAAGVILFALFGGVNLTEQKRKEHNVMAGTRNGGDMPKNITIPSPGRQTGLPSNPVIPKSPPPTLPTKK